LAPHLRLHQGRHHLCMCRCRDAQALAAAPLVTGALFRSPSTPHGFLLRAASQTSSHISVLPAEQHGRSRGGRPWMSAQVRCLALHVSSRRTIFAHLLSYYCKMPYQMPHLLEKKLTMHIALREAVLLLHFAIGVSLSIAKARGTMQLINSNYINKTH
jgi:hypothetical protein